MTEQQRHEELLRGYAESGECARGGTLWLDDIRVLLAALDTAREERDAALARLAAAEAREAALRDAVAAICQEPFYERTESGRGISTKFLMRMTMLKHAAGHLRDDDPFVLEAVAALAATEPGQEGAGDGK